MEVRRAFVTGASEGIGRRFAERLAARGFHLTVVARNRTRLRELVEGLEGRGHEVLEADLATEEGLAAAVGALESAPCNLLVNNAAFGAVGSFAEVPLPTQQAMLRLNVEALVVLAHAFLRQARPGDTLVNVSSVVGLTPQPEQPVYSASKAFVTSFTECLWAQSRARGIIVVGLHPGATETLFRSRAGGDPQGSPMRRRLLMTPDDVVTSALEAMDAGGNPLVVSGLANRMLMMLARFLGRRLTVQVMSRFK
jgi:hypothetical protein